MNTCRYCGRIINKDSIYCCDACETYSCDAEYECREECKKDERNAIKYVCHYGSRYAEGIVWTIKDAKRLKEAFKLAAINESPNYNRFIFKAYHPHNVKFDRWGDIIEGGVSLD